jgi:hypothetical protein
MMAAFRTAVFPTAIVIANFMDLPITALQIRDGFLVEAKSTSYFALDEPFGSPNIHILVGDDDFVISIADDHDSFEIGKSLNDEPIFVSVATNYDGTRVVVISQDLDDPEDSFERRLVFTFETISIAFIDRTVSEFLLVTMKDVRCDVNRPNFNSTVAKMSVQSIQVDDQNPLASSPVVFSSESVRPFMSIETLVRNRTTRFWSVVYGAVRSEPCALNVDAAFLTDLFELLRDFGKGSTLSSGYSPRVGLEWLETSGMSVAVKYRAMSDRPTITAEIERVIRPIPSLRDGYFVTQGTLIKSVRNYFMAVVHDYVAASKLDLYKQAIEEYGKSSWFMRTMIKLAASMEIPVSQITRDITNIQELRERLSEQQLNEIRRQINEFRLSPSMVIERLGEPSTTISVLDQGSDVASGIFKLGQPKRKFEVRSGRPRMRSPQGFVNNRMGEYNQDVAKAQLTVQSCGFPREKIRLICRCQVKLSVICVTDQFLFVFTPKLERLVQAIQIIQIAKLEGVNKDISVQGKKTSEMLAFRCPDVLTMERFQTFIASQKFMLGMLGRSILR